LSTICQSNAALEEVKYINYEDPAARFSILYPAAWKVIDGNLQNAVFFKSGNEKGPIFSIFIQKSSTILESTVLENNESAQAAYLQGFVSGLKSALPNVKVDRVGLKREDKGLPSIEIQFSFAIDQLELMALSNTYITGKNKYTLMGVCESNYFAANVPTFETMFSSFRLK
jgi:hypothetical protein